MEELRAIAGGVERDFFASVISQLLKNHTQNLRDANRIAVYIATKNLAHISEMLSLSVGYVRHRTDSALFYLYCINRVMENIIPRFVCGYVVMANISGDTHEQRSN